MPRPDDLAVEVPGAAAAAATSSQADGAEPAGDDLVAALRAQLAAKDAEIAALSGGAATPMEGAVMVPVTRHGAQAIAASAFAAMTTAEVHAKVQAGEITLAGKPSVLCSDGYYCDPAYR